LVDTARTPDAVQLLRAALTAFQSHGAKDQAARTLFDLARAHSRLHSHAESLRCALEVERAIERGDVVDRSLELDVHRFLAGVYIALGEFASAEVRAERARALAEDVADPVVVAKLYETLALTRYEGGDKEAALAYLHKSIELYEKFGANEKVAETWNTLGWLFIQREQYERAAQALDRAEEIAGSAGIERLRPWLALNRGALALARGGHAVARGLAEEAGRGADGRLRARAFLLRARAIASSEAPLPEVRRAFDEAVSAHSSENPRERARAHQFYADALAARDQGMNAFAQARKALDLVGR
jgi:tetratricopeptide (TPR) repeat protein